MSSVKRDVPNLVRPGNVEKTEDLKKAYYNVPVAKSAMPYLATFFCGLFYMSMVMLFGMCQAPFYFTKICRPIVRLFGALRTPALNYIDDWFWSISKDRLVGVRLFIRTLFDLLGWTFNDKGEEGVGVKFLGFIVDSVRRTFVVPMERATAVRDALREFRLVADSHQAVNRKDLERAVGSVISMDIAVTGVRVWCRALYAHMYAVGSPTSVILSIDARKELEVLIFLITFCNGSPFLDPTHDVSMWVDSGEIGWGASVAGVEVRGQFEANVVGTSSTYRELAGLVAALSHPRVRAKLAGRAVELNMDSMCAVRNLIKGGGPVPELVGLIKAIWMCCELDGIHLLPVWRRRSEAMMQRVDALSKHGTQWSLTGAFEASVLGAFGVLPWTPDLARCGPVVSATVAERVSAVLVLPRWEAQSWWSVAVENCTSLQEAPATHALFLPNEGGLPQWSFCVFHFVY
jgi:hypothetical protein